MTTFLAFLIVTLLVVAIFHLLYESCILPELRIEKKYEMFALRDELRRLKLDGIIPEREEYAILEQMLNNGIRIVEHADLLTLIRIERVIAANKEWAEESDRRVKLLNESKNVEVSRIRRHARAVAWTSFAFGMGGWLIWVLPGIFLALVYKKTIRLVRQLLVMPPNESSADPEMGQLRMA